MSIELLTDVLSFTKLPDGWTLGPFLSKEGHTYTAFIRKKNTVPCEKHPYFAKRIFIDENDLSEAIAMIYCALLKGKEEFAKGCGCEQ